MNSENTKSLRKIISFLRDAQKSTRHHKGYLKTREAKELGIKRENLNYLLEVCEAIASKEWANLFLSSVSTQEK